MTTLKFGWLVLLLQLGFQHLHAQDKLLTILQDELNREYKQLKAADEKLYYMSYRVDDIKTYRIQSAFGVVQTIDSSHDRIFTPSLRIGDYQLDNTHGSMYGQMPANLHINDNPELIKLAIWKSTDASYKTAVQMYEQILTSKKVKVAEEDTAADFSTTKKVIYYDPPLNYKSLTPDINLLSSQLNAYTAILKQNPDLLGGYGNIEYKIVRKYFIDTEGSSIIENTTGTWQAVVGVTKANDGMDLPLYQMYYSYIPQNLPTKDSVEKDIREMSEKLSRLRTSSIADPFVGPAILSGRAAGVFFHEIFGHRLEAKRMKSDYDGQTFKTKIGSQVLPSFLSISMNPTVKNLNHTQLNGFYRYDDEGVEAEKVDVVVDGVLKNFLMTRTPINGVSGSNGHARTSPGGLPESRQSNLIVNAKQGKTDAELRQMLIAEAIKQRKEYGYLFQNVEGGFTSTGRTSPNAFNVMPIEVYKIFTDGRQDELVRGVDLIGTPLSMFNRIVASGNHVETFNGMCGAGSGWVPVSASSPAIFVDVIETQKKSKSKERVPILLRPDLDKTK
ncbi:MAG: metallopeptidase TldD-related protein [Niabella sp.]